MRESQIERHLVKRVKELGGEVRKVQWVGRQGAPDRLVMLPAVHHPAWSDPNGRDAGGGRKVYWGAGWTKPERTVWVELKNPDTIRTFPANAHERAQYREHERMRKLGQHVEVIGTIEQVEALLA